MPETTILETAQGGKYQLFHNSDAERLLVILPGRGYLADFPLLYYLRELGLNHGYDVVSVSYAFQVMGNTHIDMTDLIEEVHQVWDSLPKKAYKRLCIAGKSLGTPLAVQLAPQIIQPQLLLLTPVGGAVKMADELDTLAVIGTADHGYDPKQIEADKARPNIRWEVLDDLDHRLEKPGDLPQSLLALQIVMAVCEKFLR